MNLQYISDSSGKTTGVYIPISEWNDLKKKYEGIDETIIDVPEWQINQVRERMEEYKKDPKHALDFDAALDDIETDFHLFTKV